MFGEARQTESLQKSQTSFRGTCVGQKNRPAELTSCATPLAGLLGGAEWSAPIRHYWPMVEPDAGAGTFRALPPHLRTGCTVDYRMFATFGSPQAQLARIEAKMGLATACKLHSVRGLAPTCASQVRYYREDRGKLCHWAPGSLMPERYDMATCATELKMRDGILGEVRSGWRPRNAFELGRGEVTPTQTNLGSSSSDSETPSTSRHDVREGILRNLIAYRRKHIRIASIP